MAGRIIFLVPAAMMVLALLPMPYGYYQLLRLISCVCCGLIAYGFWQRQQQAWALAMGFVAILYNPVIKIALGREVWSVVNLISAGFMVAALWAAQRVASENGARAVSRRQR